MNKGFVYLSSLEVYGTITDDSVFVREDVQGYIDPLNIRSSYPMAKRAAEHLCHLYAVQYGLPIKIARLTQTTGSGISKDDNRVIAQFAKLASKGQDIVLHTTGESARPYCYTTDAVSAILYILLKGCAGNAYNVANEETYISARGMAEYLHDNFNPSISVRVELNENMGYAPPTKLRLSTEKLQKLGWSPRKGLKEIFERLIEYLNS
jgi:nucleoside-diphosphate-sugar epimerase